MLKLKVVGRREEQVTTPLPPGNAPGAPQASTTTVVASLLVQAVDEHGAPRAGAGVNTGMPGGINAGLTIAIPVASIDDIADWPVGTILDVKPAI